MVIVAVVVVVVVVEVVFVAVVGVGVVVVVVVVFCCCYCPSFRQKQIMLFCFVPRQFIIIPIAKLIVRSPVGKIL